MDVRPAVLAGRWYAANAERLAAEVDALLSRARAPVPAGHIVGVVVPHAALRYSGHVAAAAFHCLGTLRPEVVALVGPLHAATHARLLTTAHEAYATPLGMVAVDAQAINLLNRALIARLGTGLTPIRQDREHALEIELPFLQRVLGHVRILPVMVRDQSAHVVAALGAALAEVLCGRNALLIASSDLSHYHESDEAEVLDRELLRRLAAFDPRSVLAAASERAGAACGAGAVSAVLLAARTLGADGVTVLRYDTSAAATGDRSAVVGYGAAVIWQAAEPRPEMNHP
jgi:MEMO1 family protein